MNCRQGDLAIVVNCPEDRRNIGAIRVCVAMDRNPFFGTVGWRLDRPLPSGHDAIADIDLRPLRPSDDEDETLRIAGWPQQRDETLSPKRQVEHT
jgi:hypothetical protein